MTSSTPSTPSNRRPGPAEPVLREVRGRRRDAGAAGRDGGVPILAFDPTLDYDIRMVKGASMTGGGLFNCVFEGQGALAITTHGKPMVVPMMPDSPMHVDTQAILAWSSSLQSSIHRSEGLKSFVKGGSGEMFQLVLQGQGFVVVQPSEGPTVPTGNSSGGGGGIGDLFSGD